MKVSLRLILLGLVVASATPATKDRTLTRKEFLINVKAFAERMLGFMKFKEGTCPEGLVAPCYHLGSIKDEYGMGSAELDNHLPYMLALQYGTKDKRRALALDNAKYRKVSVITEGNPECEPMLMGLTEVGSALVGKGEIELTQTKAESISKQYKNGININIPNPFNSESSLFKYSNSHEELSKNVSTTTQGTIFKAPDSSICVPVSLMIALKCKFPKRKLLFFDANSKHVSSQQFGPSEVDTLPTNFESGRQFFPVTGCISEYLTTGKTSPRPRKPNKRKHKKQAHT